MSRKSQPPKPPPVDLDPLLASRPWVWVVLGFCVLAVAFFLYGAYLAADDLRYGGEFYLWARLGDNLLRAAIAAGLIYCLVRYLRALGNGSPGTDVAAVHRAVAAWWTVLAVGLLVYMAYFLWSLAMQAEARRFDRGEVREVRDHRGQNHVA